MKVACFVNPLVQTSGPGFNYGGVQALVELLQPLHREARCECALITGRWFKDWARQNGKTHLLNGLRTVWLDELSLYRRLRKLGVLPTELDQTEHQADDTEQPTLGIIAEMIARHVNDGPTRYGSTWSGATSGEIHTPSVFISIILAPTGDPPLRELGC